MSQKATVSCCTSVVPWWGATSCSLRLHGRAVHFSDLGTSPSGFAWGLLFLNNQRLLVEINFLYLFCHWSNTQVVVCLEIYHGFSIRALSSYRKSTKIGQSTLAWIEIGTFYVIMVSAFPIIYFLQKGTKETLLFFIFFFIYMQKKSCQVSTFFLRFFFWQRYVCLKQQNIHGNSAMTINLSVLHVSCPSLLNFMRQMKNHSG